MEIFLATDHAGFEMKEAIKAKLVETGFVVKDFGALSYQPEDDYPDYVRPACQAVAADDSYRGIILGGSGYGEAIVANRIRGIRAIVCNGDNLDLVGLGREHNDANVLALGARFLTEEFAWEAVQEFLKTDFSGDERHMRRIAKIDTESAL